MRPIAITAACLATLGVTFEAPAGEHGMPWDPFIADCMARGETRSACFDQLPPDLGGPLASLQRFVVGVFDHDSSPA